MIMTSQQVLAFLSVFFIAVAGAHAGSEVNKGWFSGVAIDGYDSVAYHLQNKAIQGKKKHSVEYNDATWYFHSEKNKDLFKENPKKYIPQYGGYCAYAVAKGTTAGIDPKQFHIDNGKLYLNYSKDIAQKWLQQKDKLIQQADRNWPDVVD